MKKIFTYSLFLTLIFLGCQSNVPRFDEDHAFSYLVAQCDFGPRNPGSDGYYACLDYLITELDQSANEIILQDFSYQERRYNKQYNFEISLPALTRIQNFRLLFLPIGIHVLGQTKKIYGKTGTNPSLGQMMVHPVWRFY